MTITKTLKTLEFTGPAVVATEVRTVSFRPGLGTGDAFADGCRLHETLAEGSDHPVVGLVRREVRKLGGGRLHAERSFREWAGVPPGRADLVASGPGGTGVVEIKVVATLPDEPRGRDACQLGGYTRLAAHWARDLARAWAVLCYVDLAAGQCRMFVFRGRELRQLVRVAEERLAA